jgi:hypothetical protein
MAHSAANPHAPQDEIDVRVRSAGVAADSGGGDCGPSDVSDGGSSHARSCLMRSRVFQ